MSKRNAPHPRKSNTAPRQMVDEAMIRRIQTTSEHGLPTGHTFTGGPISRSAVDAGSYNVNGT